MNTSLEDIYNTHHATRRGDSFVLLGDERGDFLKRHIAVGKKVLDIGCRDGALTAHYAEGNEVTGVDIDSAALERAMRTVPGLTTKQMDLNGNWDALDQQYDVVVAAEVVEHLYYPENVCRKVAHVLKPGGLFLGTVPNAFSLINRVRYLFKQKKNTPLMDPTHINHFTVQELRAILEHEYEHIEIYGLGRLGVLARTFPQLCAFDLAFKAQKRR